MERDAVVEGIRRYTIHGEPYAIVYFSHPDDPDTIRQAQLSDDAMPAGLKVSDAIVITYIGTIVAGMRRG